MKTKQTTTPVFRSPIDLRGYRAGNSGLTMADLTGVPLCYIQGPVADLLTELLGGAPAGPGRVVVQQQGLLAQLTPTDFYLVGHTSKVGLPPINELTQLFQQAERFAHATDLTHGKAVIRLQGEQAGQLLSKICGLDFHEQQFPSGRVAQSSAAKISTLIIRYDDDALPTYYLLVNRPLGQYFWEIVWDAGQEFHISTM